MHHFGSSVGNGATRSNRPAANVLSKKTAPCGALIRATMRASVFSRLLFVPCSKRKRDPQEIASRPLISVLPKEVRDILRRGQRSFVRPDTKTVGAPAAYIYDGHFFRSGNGLAPEMARLHKQLVAETFIISAGYGLIGCMDGAGCYDAVLTGRTAREWRKVGLTDAISRTIRLLRPQEVYGFFPGKS